MTRNLIISVLVSLDGYIADEQGSVLALEQFYRDHLPAGVTDWRVPPDFDTVLVGKNTYKCYYHSLLNMTQKEVIVFSHAPLAGLGANMRCFSGDVSSVITQLKASEGKNIWLFGGGALINQVVCSDLVDQIRLITLPLNLTKGIALFDTTRQAPKVNLQSLETKYEMSYSIWTK